jgi:hypothetical protein
MEAIFEPRAGLTKTKSGKRDVLQNGSKLKFAIFCEK